MERYARVSTLLERTIPLLVLSILLFYVYAELWVAPYVGFNFSPSTGEIRPVFVADESALLQEGDYILQVESVNWAQYTTNMRQELFPHVSTGDSLTIAINRNGQIHTVAWKIQPPALTEIADRVVNVWWLGLFFWLTGTLTVLLVRPKDTRWRLLVAFCFLTALWLVIGNHSRWRFWDSAILLRMIIWLSVPVYLHLHWLFPLPLSKLPHISWYALYLICGALAIAEWLQWLPTTTYFLGFLFAVLGSSVLLLLHFWLRPEQRSSIRLIFVATLLAFVPIAGINLALSFHALPWYGAVGLLGLLPIPAAYFYTVYRKQLGGLELRTNRLVALYLFLMLVTTLTVLVASFVSTQRGFSPVVITVSMIMALVSGTFTIFAFPPFQRLVEKYILGVPTAPTALLEQTSARLATTLNLADLLHILRDEIPALLLIRQSALLRCEAETQVTLVFATGVDLKELPNSLEEQAAWVHLRLPLVLGEQQTGMWLIGKRDPDDYFAPNEVAVLQVLANQVAAALANIEQTEQLRAIYRANVDRSETERVHLAHILHDDVLQQMATLALSVDPTENSGSSTAQFDQAYQQVTEQIRQLITGLRPAMLTYGLGAAIEEYVDSLAERTGDNLAVICTLANDDGCRFASKIEEFLFRIVQQACENAFRHAHASTIRVAGEITQHQVWITVEDNGIGFMINERLDLPTLLAHQHFGLVGMHERAAIIGADLQIRSTPKQGTQVKILWHPSVSVSSQQ